MSRCSEVTAQVRLLKTIERVLLGDHATTEQAVNAFLKAVLATKPVVKSGKRDNRELELLNRKIKATVAMLADPTFDGLDELRSTLADLKARHDALAARVRQHDQPVKPGPSADDLRKWAMEQFARLADLATRTQFDLKDRRLVESFVQRIEIDPETKTGTVVLLADLENALKQSSTRVSLREGPGVRGRDSSSRFE